MRIHRIFQTALFLSTMMMGCNGAGKKGDSEEEQSNPQGLGQAVKTEGELPACTPKLLSQLFWVEELQAFKLCDGEKFVEISIKGATGSEGQVGPTGPKGSAANSGVWVFDANGKIVGLQMAKIILLSNEGLMAINFSNGRYVDTAAVNSSTGEIDEHKGYCSFSSNDCTGQCYQAADEGGFGSNIQPLKNAVYFNGTSYFIATGSETAVSVTMQSYYRNGTCTQVGGSTSAYPIMKIYSLPSEVTIPIPLPMYFGTKAE